MFYLTPHINILLNKHHRKRWNTNLYPMANQTIPILYWILNTYDWNQKLIIGTVVIETSLPIRDQFLDILFLWHIFDIIVWLINIFITIPYLLTLIVKKSCLFDINSIDINLRLIFSSLRVNLKFESQD